MHFECDFSPFRIQTHPTHENAFYDFGLCPTLPSSHEACNKCPVCTVPGSIAHFTRVFLSSVHRSQHTPLKWKPFLQPCPLRTPAIASSKKSCFRTSQRKTGKSPQWRRKLPNWGRKRYGSLKDTNLNRASDRLLKGSHGTPSPVLKRVPGDL